eukprot:502744_1
MSFCPSCPECGVRMKYSPACSFYCGVCGYGNRAITQKNAKRYGYKISKLTGHSYSKQNNAQSNQNHVNKNQLSQQLESKENKQSNQHYLKDNHGSNGYDHSYSSNHSSTTHNHYSSSQHNKNKQNNNKKKKGGLHDKTIAYAENCGDFDETQIKWLKKSKNSLDPEHIHKHRGVQTYLQKQYGYKSTYYYDNCDLLDEYGFKAVEHEEINEHIMDNEYRHLYDDPKTIPHHDNDYNLEDIEDGYVQWNEDFGWQDQN